MAQRDQDYIRTVRQYNRQIWESLNELISLQREWNALDYGSTLADGAEDNEGITTEDVGAVVFDSANAIVAVLNAGSATNMAKLL